MGLAFQKGNEHYHRHYKTFGKGPNDNIRSDKKISVRGNWISDTWNSFWNFMLSWTERSWWNMFAVQTVYNLMPLVGGYVRAESYSQYSTDKHTFQNAGISEDYLYYESM